MDTSDRLIKAARFAAATKRLSPPPVNPYLLPAERVAVATREAAQHMLERARGEMRGVHAEYTNAVGKLDTLRREAANDSNTLRAKMRWQAIENGVNDARRYGLDRLDASLDRGTRDAIAALVVAEDTLRSRVARVERYARMVAGK